MRTAANILAAALLAVGCAARPEPDAPPSPEPQDRGDLERRCDHLQAQVTALQLEVRQLRRRESVLARRVRDLSELNARREVELRHLGNVVVERDRLRSRLQALREAYDRLRRRLEDQHPDPNAPAASQADGPATSTP